MLVFNLVYIVRGFGQCKTLYLNTMITLLVQTGCTRGARLNYIKEDVLRLSDFEEEFKR